MWKELRAFILRGNVIDLAVAVVIGAAFTTIVTSLVQDLINPLIGVFGSQDFSNYYFVLSGEVPAGTSYAAARETANAVVFGYGAFLTACLNFLLIGIALFFFVKLANRLQAQKKQEDTPKAPELSKDQQLLTEIRDILQGMPGSQAAPSPDATTAPPRSA